MHREFRSGNGTGARRKTLTCTGGDLSQSDNGEGAVSATTVVQEEAQQNEGGECAAASRDPRRA